MSASAVEHLIAQSEALVRALDAQDLAAIDGAHRQLREALAQVAAVDGWHVRSDLHARLVHALRLLDAAKGRVNYLADSTRRRLDRLAALTGTPRTSPYGRGGRIV